jgi:hypothetical protein
MQPINRAGDPLGRRAFLAGGVAAAALVATGAGCSGGDDDDAATGASDGLRRPRRSGLALRGVNYDTDRDAAWKPRFVRHEIKTIARDLHCNAVFLLGHKLERLTLAAEAAADQGLAIWFEPRHFDANAQDTTDYVATVARAAEQMRLHHRDVGLSLGVELTIFMDGLVPGHDYTERAQALGDPENYEAAKAGLNRYLADALPTVRGAFGGPITYSSGAWEEVDWRRFDAVGVDLYRDADNQATYTQEVRKLRRHRKPVIITEFGCCSYKGADAKGGSGFEVVDWANPAGPVVPEGVVRDEQVQARYIDELLEVYEAERVHGAFVYDFIEPGNTTSPDPRHDLDMTGFALVTCYPAGSGKDYAREGYFEPKAGFHTLARRYRRLERKSLISP